jgi:hypothetical protein
VGGDNERERKARQCDGVADHARLLFQRGFPWA